MLYLINLIIHVMLDLLKSCQAFLIFYAPEQFKLHGNYLFLGEWKEFAVKESEARSFWERAESLPFI